MTLLFVLFVQYTYSAPVEEYNAMVYVKRRDTFHVDSSPDLYGEVKVHFMRARFYYFLACWLSTYSYYPLRVFSPKTQQ